MFLFQQLCVGAAGSAGNSGTMGSSGGHGSGTQGGIGGKQRPQGSEFCLFNPKTLSDLDTHSNTTQSLVKLDMGLLNSSQRLLHQLLADAI